MQPIVPYRHLYHLLFLLCRNLNHRHSNLFYYQTLAPLFLHTFIKVYKQKLYLDSISMNKIVPQILWNFFLKLE